MSIDPATIERADRIGIARARLLPLAGIGLIVGNALTVDSGSAGALVAWLALFAAAFVVVVTGGVWPRQLRALTDDEGARANRRAAVFTGYIAAVACTAGLVVVTLFVDMPAREALRIVLATAVAAPMIGFGARERMALR